MISQKREQAEIAFQKQSREEIFKLKRQRVTQNLPFSEGVHYRQDHKEAFELGIKYLESAIQPKDSTCVTIAYISHLSQFFESNDCSDIYETAKDIEEIFKVFDRGFPQIDRCCLNILRAFTLPNHATCAPILEYIPNIVECFERSRYEEIKSSCLVLFRNLAADCYVCRDRLLVLKVPKQLWGLIKTLPLREEFTEMMINIVQMKPDITYHQYVEHSELVQTLYTQMDQMVHKVGLLHFISKVYNCDRALVRPQFIIDLCSTQVTELGLMREKLSIFQAYSLGSRKDTFEVTQVIVEHLQGFLNHILKDNLTTNIRRMVQKVFIILQNFVLDGIEPTDAILNKGLSTYLVTPPEKYLGLTEFGIFCLRCLQSCSYETIMKLDFQNQLMKMYMGWVEMGTLEDMILEHTLEMVLVLLERSNKALCYFLDQNFESIIIRLQGNENLKIYELCRSILELIDSQECS